MKQDETLKAIREEINQLTGAGKQGTQWSRSSVEPHPPELSLLPVANMENVWAVEACLSCPENFNVFVDWLWRAGGYSVRECTRNVLRKMMTTTVAAQMCYAGRSSAKTGFATLKLGHVLQASVQKAFPEAKETDVALAAGDFFRFAPGVLRNKEKQA